MNKNSAYQANINANLSKRLEDKKPQKSKGKLELKSNKQRSTYSIRKDYSDDGDRRSCAQMDESQEDIQSQSYYSQEHSYQDYGSAEDLEESQQCQEEDAECQEANMEEKQQAIRNYILKKRAEEQYEKPKKEFKCKYCKNKYNTAKNLNLNQSISYGLQLLLDRKQGYLCQYCTRYYILQDNRNNHEMYSCPKRQNAQVKASAPIERKIEERYEAIMQAELRENSKSSLQISTSKGSRDSIRRQTQAPRIQQIAKSATKSSEVRAQKPIGIPQRTSSRAQKARSKEEKESLVRRAKNVSTNRKEASATSQKKSASRELGTNKKYQSASRAVTKKTNKKLSIFIITFLNLQFFQWIKTQIE